MDYYFSRNVALPFDLAVVRVTEELKQEGFGILTEIDMQTALKKKLNVDIPPCKILGACNPPFVLRALQVERMVGTMLPCNVMVQEGEGGWSEIACSNPVAAMQAVANPVVAELAGQIRDKLRQALDRVG